MKRLFVLIAMIGCLACVQPVGAQPKQLTDSTELVQSDTLSADSAMALVDADLEGMESVEGGGLHKMLKSKFIEGSAGFMSLVALALVLGLAFCIERIIYLTLSEVKAKKLMQDIDAKLMENDVEGAKDLCRDTRGPVASICYQGLLHIQEPLDQIDRQLTNYGTVQISNMEKGCSWIKFFIAVAPSLGFLGTVIGMVMAFDQIQTAGDISPTIVASGMKVALITTIFGIIVALVLQFFYNYILAKIEHLTAHMEESAITFMDSVTQYKARNNG
ncbi:MAG: MotA/TolQ/ExbB proton channel family protein [Prevotella sp.]|nr:MotA/TolQ/ExbB proton channel family protein [Prevotella sp.]